jgi:hypothetical protein
MLSLAQLGPWLAKQLFSIVQMHGGMVSSGDAGMLAPHNLYTFVRT